MQITYKSSQNNLGKDTQSWKIHTTQFQDLLYSNRGSVYWHKDKYTNRIDWKSPKISPQVYSQPIFNKCAEVIQWQYWIVFSTNGVKTAGYLFGR